MRKRCVCAVALLVLLPLQAMAFNWDVSSILNALNWEQSTTTMTADMAVSFSGPMRSFTNTAKVYKDGVDKLRLDFEPKLLKEIVRRAGGDIGDFYMVIDKTNNLSFVALPNRNAYVEYRGQQIEQLMQAFKGKLQNQIQSGKIKPQNVEKLGTESINGYSCEKVRFTADGLQGGKTTITGWFAESFRNFPLKIMSEARGKGGKTVTSTVEFRNIRKNVPSGSYFAIPSGYQKYNRLIDVVKSAN